MTDSDFRCGMVALIGAPNAGKSTLLNAVLGTRIAITSSKPQTTRNKIVGIHNDKHSQAVLIDTPGIHPAGKEINKAMVRFASDAISDADIIVYIVDMMAISSRIKSNKEILSETDKLVISAIGQSPVIVALNKIDAAPPMYLLPAIEKLKSVLNFKEAIPISAKKVIGVNDLMHAVGSRLPIHPPLFGKDQWTEVTERFLVSELVREQVIASTSQEIPYSTAIVLRKFDETERFDRGLVRIMADIVVERPSQKGIVIGKKGTMIHRIGSRARIEIERLLECQVHIELFVKVEPNWTRKASGLKKVGLTPNANSD